MPVAPNGDLYSCVQYMARTRDSISYSDELVALSTGLILEARALLTQLDDRWQSTYDRSDWSRERARRT